MRVRRITVVLAPIILVAVLTAVPGSAGARRAPTAEAAHWRGIATQTFESTFPPPSGKWVVNDYNGPTGGTEFWDDAASPMPVSGSDFWAAHPADGHVPYPNLVDSWMRYGPFSLANASDARVTFRYLLQTEPNYDFFGWEYSCNGVGGWHATSVSGSQATWKTVTMSLRPCIHKTNVFVRWTFHADYSNSVERFGAYVDDIKVQQYF
jgi:hypothetical protein